MIINRNNLINKRNDVKMVIIGICYEIKFVVKGQIYVFNSQQISHSIVRRLGGGLPSVLFPHVANFFFFSKTHRMYLGSSHYLTQRVPRLLSPRLYRVGNEVDHSPALGAKL